MHFWRVAAASICLFVLLAIGGAGSVWAHAGHEEAPPPIVGPINPRVAAHSEIFELVGVAQGKTLTIYLDRFRDNSPVTGARVEVGAPDGKSVVAIPAGEGTYRLTADWLAAPGRHDLVFTLTADSEADLLAGTLTIPMPDTISPQSAGALSLLAGVRRIDPWVAFLLGIAAAVLGWYLQSLLALRAQRAAMGIRAAYGFGGRQTVRLAVVVGLIGAALLFIGHRVFAHDAGDGGTQTADVAASGEVASPRRLLDGSVFLPKNSQSILRVRTAVMQTRAVARSTRIVGQVIADPGSSGVVHATIRGRLEPVDGKWPQIGQSVESGQVLAEVVPVVNPIDRGIIMQQLSQIDHDIGLAQQRLSELAKNGAATALMRDDARAEIANLVRRREAIALVIRDRDHLRAPLLAPSSGVIATSYAVSGQIVGEQTKLFEVVDPKRLWIEGYAYDVNRLGKVLDADAMAAGDHNYHLKFVNRGPQLDRQTIPLFFKIDYPDANLSVGSLVTILVHTADSRTGLIVPRSAVVEDTTGQKIVWQHDHAEGFVAMPVRTEPVDGDNVLVVAGLEPNARIVVDGADLLTEIR